MVDVGDDDSGGSVEGDDMYKKRTEPVLVLLSDSYPDNEISISDSRPSSCPVYTFY